jgi:phage tail-like protein
MPTTTPGSKQSRAYASGRFELELDGSDCGVLNAVDGGHFKSEAIGEQVGGEGLVTRYPGRQKFEDITITCGSTMSPTFWKWVADSIANKPSRRNGAIVSRDFDDAERARRTFSDALISEIQFPQLDLKSKSPKNVTVKITPERITYAAGNGAKKQVGPGDVTKQKKQTPQNFNFHMEGFERENTRRVVKIDALTIKQNVINAPVGGLLYAPKEAGRVEYPTVSFYIPETYLGPWMKWWEQFVGQGNHVGDKEHTGAIEYLDSTFQEVLLTLNMRGVGITGITFDKHEGHAESIRNAKVDLYVESMTLKA